MSITRTRSSSLAASSLLSVSLFLLWLRALRALSLLPSIGPLVLDADRTCVQDGGTVYCRGGNAGSLAIGTGWVRLPFGSQVSSFACGDAHCCAQTFDNLIYCMGAGSEGRIGIGDASDANFLPRFAGCSVNSHPGMSEPHATQG